jgi:lysophospholipase L1-like esterase
LFFLKNQIFRIGLMVFILLSSIAQAQINNIAPSHEDPEYQKWLSMKDDWSELNRYQQANEELLNKAEDGDRVVFMGNSITEGWSHYDPELFSNPNFVNRAIGGQTTPQMLIRFRQDVVELNPAVVVLLCGTNDLAGNTGPATNQMIQDNIASMAEIAMANGISIVLSSILPVYDYPWSPGLYPAPRIKAINTWMKAYAIEHGHIYLDYYSAMVDERGGLPVEYARDGVHPTKAGYEVMGKLASEAIGLALSKKRNQ